MSENSKEGAAGPPSTNDALSIKQRPTYEQEVRTAMLVLFVVILLAMVALLYVICWLCGRMAADRGVETEESEATEDEPRFHEGFEPRGDEEISEQGFDRESAKRCHPSAEKKVELVMPKKTEAKEECVAIETLRPSPQYSHIPPENKQIYVGGLSERLKERPKQILTLEALDMEKSGHLPETARKRLLLHTGKSPPKMPQEKISTGVTPVLATSDQVAAAQVQLPTQSLQGGFQPVLASPRILSTPGPQSQMTPQTGPASSDMMIMGQSSAKSASSADGFSADTRAADAGVRITGATVSIKPMRRKTVRNASREKRTVLPQPKLPEVTTPPQTARTVTLVSSKPPMASKSSKGNAGD